MKKEDIKQILDSIQNRENLVLTLHLDNGEVLSYPLRYKATLYEAKPQWCIWMKDYSEWLPMNDWSTELVQKISVESL